MRLLLHDFAGHAFPLQLSRALARRGHEVTHAYAASIHGPRGDLLRRPQDPASLQVVAIHNAGEVPKYQLLRRYQREREYARKLPRLCADVRPEVVLCANTPSTPLYQLAVHCRRSGIRFIPWVQDLYGEAASRLLRKRLPVVGAAVGAYFKYLDRLSLQASDGAVVITEDFLPPLRRWGLPEQQVHVVHNWAPIEDLPPVARDNPWAQRQQLSPGLRFIYSGTLAMKHNPAILLALARHLEGVPGAQLLVVSEGPAVEWLMNKARDEGLGCLSSVGFQAHEDLPQVLGAADVLVAILEPDAGEFSVPSKILSYFCAQRPVLLAVSAANLSARIVAGAEAGIVADPTAVHDFVSGAARLGASDDLRRQLGANGRRYAEANFRIEAICDRFERILQGPPSPTFPSESPGNVVVRSANPRDNPERCPVETDPPGRCMPQET